MKLLIIRHAEPDYSIDSLTEKGWREAHLLADMLVKQHIDDFYLSPLGRAQDTARPTLERLGRTGETLAWMREFEGRYPSAYTGEPRRSWDLMPSVWCKEETAFHPTKWTELPLYGEQNTVAENYAKVTAGVDELLARYGWHREGQLWRGGEDKTVALICHFALGMAVFAHLTGMSTVVAQNNFYLAPSSVTALVTETDGEGNSHFRATSVGDISHLYAGGEPMSLSGLYPPFDD